MAVIECVPNVSEGRRTDVIQRLADSLNAVPGLSVLDVQSDAAHNRSVFTLAGDADAMAAGIPRLIEGAMAAIDLRSHKGEHPRMGAVDVVPFIPIEGVTMDACVQLAKSIAADVASRFSLPVYLYEEASSNPARKNLEDIRRGEFEGLAAKMAQPAWAPDYGPGRTASDRGRDRDRRADAAHRLQHQPRHQPSRRGQEDRGRRPHEQRRPSLCQGDGHPARRPRHRPGVDEPDQLREDADLPRLRSGEARSGALRRAACSRARSWGWCRRRRSRQCVEYYLQLEGFSGAQVLENKLRSRPGA